MQPESEVIQPEWQQELRQELKDLLEQGLEHEQQELQKELQKELQQESLFTIVLSKMLHAPKSRKEISVELRQKAISGQLNEIPGKLQKKNLVEWMVESELGEVPDRWKACHLKDKFTILVGQSPSGSSYNLSRFRMRNYNSHLTKNISNPVNSPGADDTIADPVPHRGESEKVNPDQEKKKPYVSVTRRSLQRIP